MTDDLPNLLHGQIKEVLDEHTNLDEPTKNRAADRGMDEVLDAIVGRH